MDKMGIEGIQVFLIGRDVKLKQEKQYKYDGKLHCGCVPLAIYSQVAEICLHASLQKRGGPAESSRARRGPGVWPGIRGLNNGSESSV